MVAKEGSNHGVVGYKGFGGQGAEDEPSGVDISGGVECDERIGYKRIDV